MSEGHDGGRSRFTVKIITGVSGSGKTVALRALEDIGYYCVDNLPPQLIESFVSTIQSREGQRGVAIGIDVREGDFLPGVMAALPALKEKFDVEIVYLDAESDVLVRRFKETRRPHPLARRQGEDVEGAIRGEKGYLLALRDIADTVIDTSPFNPHELREHMISAYGGVRAEGRGLNVVLMSFGYKYGTPRNADLLFDVRFLPNPHFVPELRALNGKDKPVSDFVLNKPQTGVFLDKLMDMLEFLIPLYKAEGKSYLTVGIGCTGGQHRSTALAEEVSKRASARGLRVSVIHRDL